MEGFFTKKETESKSRPDGKTYSCASCGLIKKSLNPRFLSGKFGKKIMVIGTGNSKGEDERQKHWQGEGGRLLKNVLSENGIDLYNDCISLNAVNCICKEKPLDYSIECCRKFVEKTIKEYKPKMILICGPAALFSLIGHRYNSKLGEFSKWRGWQIPDTDSQTWLCPIYHPDWVLNSKGKETSLIWEQDVAEACKCIDNKIKEIPKPEIQYLEDLEPLLNIEKGVVAIDYETTGLKPHAPGHKIVCASVALSPTFAYVFMMPNNKRDREPFLKLLRNPNVLKIAHNMKYEDTWTKERLRTDVIGWEWDSMLAAHILDNRQGICGLKFQTYVNFGIADYSSEINPYLKSNKKDNNSLNKVLDLCETKQGRKKLMKYCALDTLYQYRLSLIQQEQIYKPF